MAVLWRKAGRASALAACVAMVASPVVAREAPAAASLTSRPAASYPWTPADEPADQYRRWRRHRDRDDNDTLGVLLVLGGVAAVAAAVSASSKEHRERSRGEGYLDRRYEGGGSDGGGYYDDRGHDDGRYGDRRDEDWREGRGDDRYDRRDGQLDASPAEADRAVQSCETEARRIGSVDEIHDVDRNDGEWRIHGDFHNGREFTCTVDSNGRAYVGLDDRAEAAPVPSARDRGDDRYATYQAPDLEDRR